MWNSMDWNKFFLPGDYKGHYQGDEFGVEVPVKLRENGGD